MKHIKFRKRLFIIIIFVVCLLLLRFEGMLSIFNIFKLRENIFNKTEYRRTLFLEVKMEREQGKSTDKHKLLDRNIVFENRQQLTLSAKSKRKMRHKCNCIDKTTIITDLDRNQRIEHASIRQPLDFIPTISELNVTDKRPYIRADIIQPFLELPNVSYSETVAILTLLRDSARFLDQYKRQISALTYPHRLLSVFLGESGSADDTVILARSVTFELKNTYKFNDSGVLLLNLTGGIYGNSKVRHKLDAQLYRRSHIAMARNSLLELVLRKRKFDHVLWIDSDIAEIPHDVIEQLLFAKSDVVATPCLQKGKEYKTKYDRNSWQETPESFKEQILLQTDALVVEGYNKSSRHFLPDLLSEGRIVPLDGVGGCVLMIKADCHRNGLRFPAHVYKHHIETEGLAKMARDMGYTVVGLPFVEVFHS